METQEKLLKKYKERFPKETLKTTQEKTGIHYTRIFRIYNGSEMKLKEYLKFEELLNQQEGNSLERKYKQCLKSLSENHRQVLFQFLDQSMLYNNLKVQA